MESTVNKCERFEFEAVVFSYAAGLRTSRFNSMKYCSSHENTLKTTAYTRSDAMRTERQKRIDENIATTTLTAAAAAAALQITATA